MTKRILIASLLICLMLSGNGFFRGVAAAQESAAVGDPPTIRPTTRSDWAHIRISGDYPESTQMPGLFGELAEALPTCLDRLQQATRDKSLRGVILHIDGLTVGWGKLHEIQTAIRAVRAGGKPVWAWMTDVSTKDYLLATACDRIIVAESATLMLTGLRAEVTFYRNLFSLLDIKADMLRVGAYKSAAEPYTRTEMSAEFRAEMEEILDDYFASMLAQISDSRKLSEQQVRDIIDEGLIPAARARTLGLVDQLAYEDQLPELIRNGDESLDVRLRTDYRRKKPSTELDLFSLMQLLGGKSEAGSTKPRIAVVCAEGAIVTGAMPTSFLGGAIISSEKMVPLLRKLGKDQNVKAVVLRVDSPGGSALASDLIWRELRAIGKPVVVSMGDTAASGGYYISMGAERIFAEPGTLTGSIGVVGGKVSFEGLMNRVGVTTSVIRRGRNSGVLSITEAFSDSEREVMQRMLDTIYQQFTEKAAAGRRMEYAQLEELARGRVYTGRRAIQLGLIDELGTLADAIAWTRTHVGDHDEQLELESLPKPQSPLEMLLGDAGHRSTSPMAAIAEVLPESLRPALRHWSALRLLSGEPVLAIMPFAVSID